MIDVSTTSLILKQVQNAKHILIVSHRKPDGDTTGSAIAFALLLQQFQKTFHLYCIDPILSSFQYMSLTGAYIHELKRQQLIEFDLIICLDAGDIFQTGLSDVIAHKKAMLINIDHHVTNTRFGDINYVLQLSSTCEVLYTLFEHWGIDINDQMATALLTGIMTDTDGFSNAATTDHVLEIGALLMRKGARMKQIMRHILKNKRIADLQLWGIILSRIQRNEQYKCACTVITLEDLERFNVDEEATMGIANFLNMLSDTKMALVLRELADGKIKGSFRTNQDDVDVSLLAKVLGGGGHTKAAGFTISGTLVQTKKGWKIV